MQAHLHSPRWLCAALTPRSRSRWGAAGAQYCSPTEEFRLPAPQVEAVDTTGAGDTFIGYFLQGLTADMTAREAMTRAMQAAALCVTRPGAMDSIPTADEVD